MSIKIYYDNTKFRLVGWKKARIIIEEVIGSESKSFGDLCFIITNDISLRKINVQFLNHNSNTDVITFNYTEEDIVNGEVYISIETVKKNSLMYKVNLKEEILRVMIHGVLHLLDYDDKTDEQKVIIRNLENYWLGRFEK